MADDLHYEPGDFYRIDDRSGFKVRARRTRKEWTNLIVDQKLWEPRHPQDFVKGVIDDQSVPEPRPRQTDVFLGVLQTNLTANAVPAATTLNVQSCVRFINGDTVQIMLDSKEYYTTTVGTVLSHTSFTIPSPGLPYFASSGNQVQDLSADAVANI